MFHGGAASGLTGNGESLEPRFDLAVDQLRELAPDVVALQEASTGWGRGNLAARLAERLGLHYVHAPATTRVLGVEWLGRIVTALMNFSEGPAILSRYPIVSSEVYDLPRCQKTLDPRVVLRAELATPAGPLHVFSTHTSRDTCQVRRALEIARGRKNARPVLIMGDFNTGDSAMAEILAGMGLIDAYRQANPSALGFTVWQDVTAPIPTAFRRVDYILVVPGDADSGRVLGSRLVLDSPRRLPGGGTLWPSDHYGVLAQIGITPSSR
jgi:endonuclease/exonuclease/phosphatase family metal-dependent hydrolase